MTFDLRALHACSESVILGRNSGMSFNFAEALKDSLNAEAWADFERLVPSAPKRVLHHYTSISGLHGIVTTRNLWATDARFLNDPSEIQYARRLIDNTADRISSRCNSRESRDLFTAAVEGSLLNSLQFDFFLSSFSEHDDDLGQWVGYTPAAAGVSVGFRPSFFRQMEVAVVRRVLYSATKQTRLVEGVLDKYRGAFEASLNSSDRDALEQLAPVLGIVLHFVQVCLKDPAYRNEREWRAIAFQRRLHEGVKHRPSTNALVPYIEIPLESSTSRLPFSRVRLGPQVTEANDRSIREFLWRHKTKVVVHPSNVPYRVVK